MLLWRMRDLRMCRMRGLRLVLVTFASLIMPARLEPCRQLGVRTAGRQLFSCPLQAS